MKIVKIKESFFKYGYALILKPIFFKFDPEKVHDGMLQTGQRLGLYYPLRAITKASFFYQNPILEQKLHGINFPNPIGLAAGFDKNAQLTDILPEVGFGFMEVGSLTAKSCAGNSKPRIWRLPLSKSLMINYGLKNDGTKAVCSRLNRTKCKIPLGISIAKTNCQETAEDKEGIADYIQGVKDTLNIGDYLTINVSCPNAYGGQPFSDAKRMDELFIELDKLKIQKPIFIKLSPDMSDKELDEVTIMAKKHNIQGFICSNLTKERDSKKILDKKVPSSGGISGKVVEGLADQQLSYLYKNYGQDFTLIGCGGVFSATDAYKKIRLGASLIQLITGMIFSGPHLIGQINRELGEMLKKDGYENIQEAVGADNPIADSKR